MIQSVDLKTIKLIIWDLDETLWSGVLSDNTANISMDNIELIHNIVDSGVMCSICSKNNEDEVYKYLTQYGIDELFVFASINWTAKGERVLQIIQDMGLREVNVLFIDDNTTNLAEVKKACPQINVANVDYLPELKDYYFHINKKDKLHTRLQQYKVLEKKNKFKALAGSNEAFLQESDIRVEIHDDCVNHIDRIEDLVMRSNQLNFTKKRDNKDNLITLFLDPTVKNGYVTVTDNYGKYGIVGFFSVKDAECIHFVFSCRTLNMGVEQYVYNEIGKPQIKIVGEVASSLDVEKPKWINQEHSDNKKKEKMGFNGRKLLIKGPCDMEQVFTYVEKSTNIITEFSYINDKGINIEGGNHTAAILQCLTISEETIDKLVKELPFADKAMFRTALFDDNIDAVFFSLFMESHLGLYRDIDTGAIVPFGEYTNDLTDRSNWEGFINHSLFTANCDFSIKQLEYIKQHFEYMGRLSPTESFENIKLIQKKIGGKKLILNCGSELPYEGVSHEVNRYKHIFNKELNGMLQEWIKSVDNVYLINVSDYLHGQDDFINSITHFKKRVYYEISKELVRIINHGGNNTLKCENKFLADTNRFIKRVMNKIKRYKKND